MKKPDYCLRFACFFFVLFFLSGCVGGLAPTSRGMTVTGTGGQRLAAVLALAKKCPQSLAAEFDGVADTWGGPLRFSGFLLASTPASLKIVALHPGGQPFFILVVLDGSYLLLDIPAKTVHQGKTGGAAGADGLASLAAGVPWLLGRPPEGYVVEDVRAAEPDGLYWFFLRTPETYLAQVLFDPESGRILGVRQDAGGDGPAAVDYSFTRDGCLVPEKIRFRQRGGEVDLFLREIEQGKETGAQDFSLRIPPGFTVRDMDVDAAAAGS